MPTIGITWTTIHEAAGWGITREVAANLGMVRELEQGAMAMRDL